MTKGAKILIITLIIVGILLCLILLFPMFSKSEVKGSSNNNVSKVESAKGIEENKPEEVYEEFVSKDLKGNKVNISDEVKKAKIFGNYEITNMQITNDGNQTVFLGTIKNITEEETEMKEIDILMLDKEGNEIGKAGGVIIPLKPNQTSQFNSSSQLDYANIYDFKIVEK